MTSTTVARRILIAGRTAADIAQHVRLYVKPTAGAWHEVQSMRECDYGCKLYVTRRGCISQYQLIHNSTYGCRLGCNPATRTVPVSVAPKARTQAPAITADDRLLDRLGSATPGQPADEFEDLALAWRREIDTAPIGDLVDTDTAIATIRAAA